MQSYDILDHIPAGVLVVNSNFEVVFWNSIMEDWTSILKSKAHQASLSELFDIEIDYLKQRLEFIFEGGAPVLFSSLIHKQILPIMNSRGSLMTQQVIVTAVKHGDEYHALFNIEDVSELSIRLKELKELKNKALKEVDRSKELEKKLIVEKEKSEKAVYLKQEFLSTISHEIRTPMNGVIATASLMKDMGLNEEQSESLSIIMDSGENLIRIINDFLDYSKLEAGKLKLVHEEFYLEDTLHHVVNLLVGKAHEVGSDIQLDIDSSVPRYVLGDSLRLTQILLNLVGNAIKFCEGSHVVIKVTGSNTTSSNVKLNFIISDQGIGIPQEQLHTLFDSFTQVENSKNRSMGGTGLGLSITKALIQQMNGDVWVHSILGEGSQFYFNVELEKASGSAKEVKVYSSVPINSQSIRVLLVEDNLINQKIVTKMLQRAGHELKVANNGIEAIDLVKEIPFDLVLMDLHMPKMGGYEASKIIIQDLKLPVTPAIVALTAASNEAELTEMRNLGVTEVMFKPFTLDQFNLMLEGHVLKK